jgi:tetratricopeptide (TPR) repeat protein
VLERDGPVDEPTCLFRTARLPEQDERPRQAAREFARCAELAPEWPVPKLWLARCRLDLEDFAGALELTERIEAESPPAAAGGWADLLFYRTCALRGLGRTNEATACIEQFVSRHRDMDRVISTGAELYGLSRQREKELGLLDELLGRQPNDAELLARKGLAEIMLGRYDDAVATLSRALALAPADGKARLHRAAAEVEAGRLEAARADYQELLKAPEFAPSAELGLGGIAWRNHDTNAAIGFYEGYLSNSVPGSAQYAAAVERLRQLRGE